MLVRCSKFSSTGNLCILPAHLPWKARRQEVILQPQLQGALYHVSCKAAVSKMPDFWQTFRDWEKTGKYLVLYTSEKVSENFLDRITFANQHRKINQFSETLTQHWVHPPQHQFCCPEVAPEHSHTRIVRTQCCGYLSHHQEKFHSVTLSHATLWHSWLQPV